MTPIVFAVFSLLAVSGVLSQPAQTSLIRDPCSRFVCLNGGTCTAPADAPYCLCPPGFSGSKCEFSIRPSTCPVIKKGDVSVCGGVPCTSDQQCPYNEKCCTLACGGKFCSKVDIIRDPCSGFVCLNGGTCTAPADAPYCQCPKGFSGPKCEFSNRLGTCPVIKDQVSVCKGTVCTNDYDCPGEQKCCPGCRNVCRDPIYVRNQDQCGNTRCSPGLVCVLRTPYCAPGKLCILALLPVCVRPQCVNCTANEDCVASGYGYACTKTNQCGGCPLGQVCRPTNIVCVTTPCPQYACVPIDRCGGCPRGQVCRPVVCITKTCASYQCYPDEAY